MSEGLENVIATRTQLSSIDGEKGALISRGHSLEDVAGILSFEQLLALLWRDIVPELATTDAETLPPALGALRLHAFEKAVTLLPHMDSLSLVEALRFLLSAHAYEQVETGRLIRPRSEYIGPLPTAA
ncbi:MAG: hypothetical protein O2910_05125 [Proteobacteria bacterium]|nr:hypothetical protein [Pseudomonadota bacterium]